MSASLLSRLETAETSCDRTMLLDELRATTAESPDRIAPFMHLIQSAFTDLSRPIRSLAYQCALNYISSNPSMSVHFMSAYSVALLHRSADISLHALSFLSEFITASRCISGNLLSAAAIAANRWPSPESVTDLSRAVTACANFRCADLEENSNSQTMK
uniref:Integrator complex subunit 7 n=2 Tax=Wuchereria bancrofti TaxID=6293 RepID=A0A1I8EDI5_WUCBA